MRTAALGRIVLLLTGVAVAAALAIFSQLTASPGDEGFHLLPSQLLKHGRWPYVDFLYHHPPGYVMLSALWMSAFGETWRSVHVLSALLTAAMIAILCEFTYTRFRGTGWEAIGTAVVAALVGLNVLVLQHGVSAQPFALTSLLIVAAFRLAVVTPQKPRGWWPLWSGACAGAACVSSLLMITAPVPLFVWMLRNCEASRRAAIARKFLAGMIVPALLVVPFLIKAFPQFVFDVFLLQLRHRRLDGHWSLEDTWLQHLHTLTDWLQSGQGLLLVLLPLLALGYLARQERFDAKRKSEFYLCGWIAAAVAIYVSIPHPNFPWYYMPAVPFAGELAALGLFAIYAGVLKGRSLAYLLLATFVVFGFDTAKWLYDFRRDPVQHEWREIEEIAKDIKTIGCGSLYARDPRVYFATGCPPQPGLESYVASWLTSLPREVARSMHIVRQDEITDRIRRGEFSILVLSVYDKRLDSPDILENYRVFKRLRFQEILVRKFA